MTDFSEYRSTSGAYIRKWRSNLKLSYEVVAEAMGVHPITVRNWEKQRRLKLMVRLAFDQAFLMGPLRFRTVTREVERCQKKLTTEQLTKRLASGPQPAVSSSRSSKRNQRVDISSGASALSVAGPVKTSGIEMMNGTGSYAMPTHG